jgi:CBS domain-containing protein
MTRKVVSIDDTFTIEKAISIMDSKGIKELPVIRRKKYIGILFYYDTISSNLDKNEKITGLIRKAHTLRPRDSIDGAILGLRDSGIGALAVVDDDKRVVGIVSDYDVLKLLINSRVFDNYKVEDVAIRKFPILRTEDTIARAKYLAAVNEVDQLPIVDNFDKVVGEVLLSDIMRYSASSSAGRKKGKRNFTANKAATDPNAKSIMEIARRELPQIYLTINLRRALEIMLSAKMKGAVVIGNDNKPVGIVTRKSLLELLGGANVGEHINVELSGDYNWDFAINAKSEVGKREAFLYTSAKINQIRIHLKTIRGVDGKYQLNLEAKGKRRYVIKVDGMLKEMLLKEAFDKLENQLEHARREFRTNEITP